MAPQFAIPSGVRRILALDVDEANSGFDSVANELSRRGLLVVGLLGVVLTLFYILAHLGILGYEAGWSYGADSADTLVMWDKLSLVLISFIAIVASRISVGLQYGRTVLGVLIVLAAVAMILDDLAGGHSIYSVGYLTILMIIAVGAVPFVPSHVLILCGSVLVMLLLGPAVADAMGWPTREVPFQEIVYWIVCTVVLTGTAVLVYRSRYEQFAARVEIERVDAELRENAKRLAELERLKSRFFEGISHEFRTPITLILGPVRSALDRHDDLAPDVKRSLNMIERNGRRLGELVDQLLDLARLEDEHFPLQVGPHDVTRFVGRIVALFESHANWKGIELTLEESIDDPVIYFDAEQMRKVIENLLSNALKFTGDGGKVRVFVGAEPQADTIEISIKDSGSGIPAAEIDHVFDRFHQVASERPTAPGAGLGLALANELVEAQGGQILVKSELGFGSEFKLILRRGSDHFKPEDLLDAADGLTTSSFEDRPARPVPEYHVDDRDTMQAAADGAGTDAPTILIVDDHPDMLAYLTALLSEDYRIVEATDGRMGLDTARSETPDLVITDVMMPEIDGHDLCARIKRDERTAQVPVIVVTGLATRESKLEGLAQGADDYLFKPFDADELRIKVENLIEIRRALRSRAREEFEIRPSEIDEPSADDRFLAKIRQVVEDHLSDSNFTVDWMADEVGLSRRQLERKVRRLTRLTPGGLIRMMRLKRAQQYLEGEVGTIAEIAYRVGFNDPNYFSRLFRQTYGVPPSEYAAQT